MNKKLNNSENQPYKNNEKKIYVVLGMHRSGTSTIARSLLAFDGITLGESLMPGIKNNNEKGFFEDIEIANFNEGLLSRLGLKWSSLMPIDSDAIKILIKDGFLLKGVELLRSKISLDLHFAFKDPRVGKLLPFWNMVFEYLRVEPVFILCIRNPLSIVKSLAARDKFNHEKSYMLWLINTIAMLKCAHDKKLILIDYDDLIDQPEFVLSGLSKKLELFLNSQKLVEFKADFVELKLRHSKFGLADLTLDDACLGLVYDVYELLLKSKSGKFNFNSPEFIFLLEKWEAEIEKIIPLLALEDRVEQKLVEHEFHATNYRNHIAHLEQEVQQRSQLVATLEQSLKEHEVHVGNYKNHVIHLEQEVLKRDSLILENQKIIDGLIHSTSWRLTKPIRCVKRNLILLMSIYKDIKSGNYIYRKVHGIYRKLDIRYQRKIKDFYNWIHGRVDFQKLNSNNFEKNQLLLDLDFINLRHVSVGIGDIAIHIHLYYEDLSREVKQYLNNIPYPYDLFITTDTLRKCEYLNQEFQSLKNINKLLIKVVPNRGRDIGPFFINFSKQFRHYKYIAHLHGKKSLYNNGATNGWREYLFSGLLGSEDRVRKIVQVLSEGNVGIIFPQNFHMLPYQAYGWLANEGIARNLFQRMSLGKFKKGYFNFPAGSMFWGTSKALMPLFELNLKEADFDEERGQNDGTFAHCLERMLGIIPEIQGYSHGILADQMYPSWSPWRLDQYVNRPFEDRVNVFKDPTKVLIGFDIFDTLLYRPILDPETLKKIVASQIDSGLSNNFINSRNLAEARARTIKGSDVNIFEIYDQYKNISNISNDLANRIRDLEIEIEKNNLKPRAEVIDLFNEALKTGRKVILISDMFLPKDVIEEKLRDFGILGYEKLYLSNDIGLRKDSGELYKFIFNQYGIEPQQFVMCGDNERSDLQIPVDMGANHNHVMSPINFISGLPRYRKILNEVINSENIDDELTMALSVNYLGAKINNFDFNPADMVGDLYSIGRTIVGPMLLAFSNWLKEEANKDGIDKLFFLSREGKIMKDVYDLWCFGTPDYIGSEYLSVSRRSLSVPYLESLDDMVVIIDNIEFTGKLGVLLYERFGINRDEFKKNKIFDKYDLTVNLPNDRQLVIEYLNYFIPDILDKANNEKNGMIQYFHKIGILEIPKPAVVDVGYGGTAQKYLQRSISKSLYGYYMMTDERIRVTQDNGIRLAAKGFLLDGVPRNENAPNIFLKSFQIERFLSSDDTQLCFYNDDGSLSYREISRTEIEVIEKRKLLRKGIFDYVNEAIKSRKSYPQFKPSLHVAILLMQEFFDNQTENELAIVGELKLDDFYCGRGLV